MSLVIANQVAKTYRAGDVDVPALRGIDFSKAWLEGASLNSARISGAYFPAELTPEEIILSVTHGTRMRYRK